MNSITKEYHELLSLTKEYISQEHPENDFLLINAPTHLHFTQQQKTQPIVTATAQAKGPTIRHEIKPANSTPPTNFNATKTNATPPPNEAKKAIATSTKNEIPSNVIVQAETKSSPEVKKPGSFKIELAPPPPAMDFRIVRSLVKEHFPNLQILDNPPSDAKAIAINNGWKTENRQPTMLIILANESAKCRQLAENICKAVEIYAGKASLISAMEIEQSGHGWENFIANETLKLVVVSTDIRSLPRFNKLCKKEGEKDFFGNAPIVHFDIALCLTQPERKADLWQLIRPTNN